MKKKIFEKKSTKIILSALAIAGIVISEILSTQGEREYKKE